MIEVITTPKGSSSNSYATIKEADDYFEILYLAEDWFILTNDDKAKLLITATRSIDNMSFMYPKCEANQSLMFPLLKGSAEVGFDDAKKACIIQTLYLYENAEIIQSSVSENIQNIRTQNFGKVQTTKSNAGFNPFYKLDGKVYKILSEYIKLNSSLYRG